MNFIHPNSEAMSNEKKIEDYLPYYIGQKAMAYKVDGTEDGIIELLGRDFDGNWLGYIENTSLRYHSLGRLIKPILRPLSSMTEEEQEQLCKHNPTVRFPCLYDPIVREINLTRMLPDDFLYLLKQGFDIFNLKEAGLAIYQEDVKP